MRNNCVQGAGILLWEETLAILLRLAKASSVRSSQPGPVGKREGKALSRIRSFPPLHIAESMGFF